MENRFVCTDCFDPNGMPSVPDRSVNLILSDLPYGQTDHEWDIPLDMNMLWKEYNRILVENGVIALCAKGEFMIDIILSNRKMFRYEWIWNKRKGANFAHIRYRPLNVHEYILIFYNKVGTYNPQMENGKKYIQKRANTKAIGITTSMKRSSITICDGKRYPKSIINVNGIAQKDIEHPTQKPVELFEYIIKTYTNKGDVIMDNCAGVGTTAIACLNLERKYICFEKNREYYNIAMRKISNLFNVVKHKENLLRFL